MAFDQPAEYTLPNVGSMTIGDFTGASGEDAADLLFHSLEHAGHYAMFRQAPDAALSTADNFRVAGHFSGSPCSYFVTDAVLYGAVQAQAPQVSYTTSPSRVTRFKSGPADGLQVTCETSDASASHACFAAEEAPPAYTEIDESPFYDAPEQAPLSPADDLPPAYSVEDPQAGRQSHAPAPALPAPAPPVSRETSTTHQPHYARETQICRYNSQALKVTLKVGLRNGARAHLTVVSNKRHRAPSTCVIVPGEVSARQAPYYFPEVDHVGMHQTALLEAVDELSAKFVQHKTLESMVLYYDKKISLSKQALAAASASDWALAASYYERGIEYAHDHNLNLKKRARVHYNFGVALAGKGDFDEALRHLDIAEFADSQDVYSEARVRIAHHAEQARLARLQREGIAEMRQAASCTRP